MGKRASDRHAILIRVNHQSTSRDRGEWYGRDQLGIVRDAGLLGSMRPGEIPDELTHAVVLEVERHRAHQPLALVCNENARLPSRAGPDAARTFERGQEGVLEKRIVLADKGIPCRGRHLRHAGEHRKRKGWFGNRRHRRARV